ncbi:thiosulfate oxidation carrier protein SoxY [Thiohalocapsa marina]|uniref:Thiosulfate oxidation carrier protein SoxY n=1 Tax=Thiohalocapsa marina TaxID=424902 RepID=A0A5M8FVG2_9GAMM|nr:thiosulfate oxidation carrier protein SoxY [Thiohalocapsa marina]KAA6187797.1 thiosulfate oxidation carrier protein SoxY [Thiohalocapsa marina]
MKRRPLLVNTGLLGLGAIASPLAFTGALIPRTAGASWPSEAFDASALSDAEQRLFDGRPIQDSTELSISAPDIAENGRVVPVGVRIALPNANQFALFAAKNPTPLLARVHLTPAVAPEVALRVKLDETTELIAIAEADGQLYRTSRSVKVTGGGCGGG